MPLSVSRMHTPASLAELARPALVVPTVANRCYDLKGFFQPFPDDCRRPTRLALTMRGSLQWTQSIGMDELNSMFEAVKAGL